MSAPAPLRPCRRRRFLRITAGAAAAVCVPAAARAEGAVDWRGRAFGADAALSIRDPDRARARAALAGCLDEIRRLERLFSLYDSGSALSVLNRDGTLDRPPAELVDVLSFAAGISAASGGAFDVTVQPLWGVYVRAQRDPRGFDDALADARARIGWRRLTVSAGRIAFAAPGMAATLNGIVPGYAADRIALRLRDLGFRRVLVDLGEIRAVGEREPGEPWRIGVGGGDDTVTLRLADRAVATSSPAATVFAADGSRHHLFDPRTGGCARSWVDVSVVADGAMRADALSTAIAVAPEDAAAAILAAGGGETALLTDRRGRRVRLGA